jgi:hypothetical protein
VALLGKSKCECVPEKVCDCPQLVIFYYRVRKNGCIFSCHLRTNLPASESGKEAHPTMNTFWIGTRGRGGIEPEK